MKWLDDELPGDVEVYDRHGNQVLLGGSRYEAYSSGCTVGE